MKASRLAFWLARLEKETARNKLTQILAQLLDEAETNEIDKICWLTLGKLAPDYKGVEFNLAEKMIIRAIALAFNRSPSTITSLFKQKGDLGEVVFALKKQQKTPTTDPSISHLYQQLYQIASQAGEGSQERKLHLLADLLSQLPPLAAKFIVRIPIGKLRLGFSELTILDALSWMVRGDKSLRPVLERAYNVSVDIGRLAVIFKTKGVNGIKKIQAEPGIPIRPALAERLSTAKEIIKKLGKAAVEPKYDGFRVQIHLDKSKKTTPNSTTLFDNSPPFLVRIFSRNLEDTTFAFPEIVTATAKLPVKSAILDGEAIGYNPTSGQFLPFQQTVQRKRKYEVKKMAKKIPLRVFVFDLLYLNGHDLLNLPFLKRRKLLEKIFVKQKDSTALCLTEQHLTQDPQKLNQLFLRYIKAGLEGVVCKRPESNYQAGARNFNWVKFKRAMRAELADTIDCLVMGYYRGRGKRASFGIGAFLAGIWDPKQEAFLTIAKIGTGLTDQQWVDLRQRADGLRVTQQPKEYRVPKELIPDVWLIPGLVVEIRADEITRSPIHTSGFALRFPRMERFRDKEPTAATTIKEIKHLYQLQQKTHQ